MRLGLKGKQYKEKGIGLEGKQYMEKGINSVWRFSYLGIMNIVRDTGD